MLPLAARLSETCKIIELRAADSDISQQFDSFGNAKATLMELVIRCRENGPLVIEGGVIEGGVKIVDHLGNAFSLPANKPVVALCRCGQSKRKPFCDGSHKTCGFLAGDTAPPGAEGTTPTLPTS